MDTIMSTAKWLLSESILGIAAVKAAVYFLGVGVKSVIPKAPNPYILAFLAFIAALFTLPSIPRYQFEKESLAQIEGKDWIRVVNKAKLGSLTEPLTWFRAPVGSIFMVMPNDPTQGGFREVLLRYGEQPRITIPEPDCADHPIFYAEPDSEGVFRYSSTKAQPMSEQETSIYCEHDWTEENRALGAELSRQWKIGKTTEQLKPTTE